MKKKPADIPSFLFKERFLFIFILLLELCELLYCIESHRLVVHDTFFRFYMQYYYLNNYVKYLEFPYWIPYLTHGTLATPWQGLVGIHGILNNVLFLTGNILKNINFLPIFYTGIFFDKLVLLTGSWLLSRRLYNSPTAAFFVCTSILISSVWASQVHLNFLFCYAIPLIIYLFHRFIETQQWRYFLLGFNLFFLQCINKLFYFTPVVSLTIFLYFFFYLLFNFRETTAHLKKIKFGFNSVASIGLILFSMVVVFSLVKSGMDGEIVKSIYQRNTDGSVPLNVFLTYAQDNSLTKWSELLIGISIKNDNTLYCGLLIPILAIFGLTFNLNRKSLPILLTCLVLFLFSLGSIVSIFFYHSWPMMKYYRHIFQIVSIVRLFLCLFAGFGWLKLLDFLFSAQRPKIKIWWLLIMSTVLFISGMTIYCRAGNGHFIANMLRPLTYDADINQMAANSQHFFPLLRFLGIKYLILSMFLYALLLTKNTARRDSIIILLIVFHAIDGYSYSLQEFHNRTVPLSAKQLQTTQFQPIVFNDRRSVEDFATDNPRHNILTPNLLSKSILSWNVQAFLFNEPVQTQLRTDHWLRPYDQYLKAYGTLPMDHPKPLPNGLRKTGLDFPMKNESAKKISGLTENKIQFFGHACTGTDLDAVAKILSSPDYRGDMIFLERTKEMPVDTDLLSEGHEQTALNSNERLSLKYEIENFSSNHLELDVSNTTNKSVWLLYSDVWHPLWKAKVNGKNTPIYKANIAYKAVLLNSGINNILFYFSAPAWEFLTFIIIINSFFWLWYIIYLSKSIIHRHD